MATQEINVMNHPSFGLWNWFNKAERVHNMSIQNRLARAFLGGLFISFGGLLSQLLSNDPWFSTNAPGLLKILEGAVFPIGLIMIVLTDVDLLTASFPVFTVAVLKRKVPVWAWILDWTIVFIGNLAGSLLYAGFVLGSGILTNDSVTAFGESVVKFGDTKMSASFGQILIRAIGCNMLVTVAIYQAALMRDGISTIVAVWFPIFAFVASGFDHVVANFYLIPSALMVGGMTLNYDTGLYIWKSLIASFIGNVIGGWIIALPFFMLYQNNVYDSRLAATASSSQEGTVMDQPSNNNDKTGQWTKTVEAA